MDSGEPPALPPSLAEVPPAAPVQLSAPATTEVPDKVVQAAIGEAQKLTQQHFLGVQVGPAPHPFANQLTAAHVTQSIEVADKQDARKHFTQRFGMIVGAVGFLLVCSLFLYMGKTDPLEKIIALFVGLAGGYGLGRAKLKE